MKVTKTFKRDELLDVGLPYHAPEGGRVIEDDIYETSRWSEHHELIVHFPDQPEGQAWCFYYSQGLTECQDESPWQDDDEVEATLMEEREVLVKKYVPVGEEASK